jgi:hypothetical protein
MKRPSPPPNPSRENIDAQLTVEQSPERRPVHAPGLAHPAGDGKTKDQGERLGNAAVQEQGQGKIN